MRTVGLLRQLVDEDETLAEQRGRSKRVMVVGAELDARRRRD